MSGSHHASKTRRVSHRTDPPVLLLSWFLCTDKPAQQATLPKHTYATRVDAVALSYFHTGGSWLVRL